MRATLPYVEVPGDNENLSMAKSGTCVGMSDRLAVWRFGYLKDSINAKAHGCYMHSNFTNYTTVSQGFLWVLATRKTGVIKDTYRGYAIELPKHFRKVIEWEPHS